METSWEHSCGYVPFIRTEQGLRYFLICSQAGKWGFPKGHMEGTETEEETADREVFEEAGLRVRQLDGFRQEVAYPVSEKPDTMKKVTFFTGEVLPGPVCLQKKEVTAAGYFSLADALERVWLEELRRVLLEADRFIKERGT